MKARRGSTPKRTVYVQRLRVRGTGTFAFDMLRHDHCFPASAQDASAMDWKPGDLGHRTIELERHAPSAQRPETARWASFGWEVVEWGPAQ